MTARRHTDRAPRSVRLAVAGVSAIVAGGLLLGVGPANAEPTDLRDAKARAKQLATEVEQLETEASVAGEDLAAAQEDLGQVVTRQISATEQLAEFSVAAQASRAATDARVRALYMGGGQASLYASVLDGGTLVDVLARVDAVGRVLDQDRAVAASDGQAVVAAQQLQVELADLSTRQTDLEAVARKASDRIDQLLQQRSDSLSAAGAEVRRLTEEWRVAQEVAAAQRAAAQLASSGPIPTDLPPASTVAGAALREADRMRGVPYVYGANGPDNFDCSSLTRWAYAKAGLALPRTSRQQWWVGPHPTLNELAPGDLLFWAYDVNNPGSIHHVALYAGNGWMIHAPRTGDVVRYARVYLDGYIGATRPVAPATR